MATHLDATLQTALGLDGPLHFFAVEVVYPSFNLRLLDGPGSLTVDGHTYTGLDSTYGTLVLPDSFSDGVTAEAPNISFGIQCPTNAAAATLCAPAAQGSAVNVWYSAANRAAGTAYTAYQVWSGQLDVATLTVDRGLRLVRVDAESWFGSFLDSFDGALLTNAWHQSIWPGELGCEYVVNVQQLLPWGSDSPRPQLIRDASRRAPTGQPGRGYAGSEWGLPDYSNFSF